MALLDTLRINELPAPTWNRLRMNYTELQGLPVPQAVCEPLVSLQGNVWVNKNKEEACGSCGGQLGCPVRGADFTAVPTGLGAEQLTQLGEGKRLRLVAEGGTGTAAVTLEYKLGEACYNLLEVEVKEGSELTLYLTCIGGGAQSGALAAVQTKLALGRGAKLKLVQVQLLGSGYTHLNDVGALLDTDASFALVQLELGAGAVYNGVRSELVGEGSDFDAALAYYGRQGQTLDMNFIANHYGKRTTCAMTADGVLQEGAKKLYRGTIDFKPGCAGAVGDEKETVLLLSDDVVNQTIPLILCSEEDVQGNHGASIGKLDEELLFYLMSRGFSEQEVINMMARGKIDALCRKIEDEDTVQLVQRYLEGVVAESEH